MNYDQQCSNVKECFLANINNGNNANHEHLDHAADAVKQFLISVRGSSDLTTTARQIWKEIISRTLVIILSVDHLPNETALKSFHGKVHPLTTNPHYKILPEIDDLQDLLQLAKEGPWISLSYKLILSGKKCNHHEVRKLIKHESVQVVTHRIKAILPDSKIAYNYGKHVITISKFKHVSEIQRLVQTAAVKCLNEDEVETAMDDFDLSVTLEVIEELRSSNEHKESFLLCHALLMRMWKSEHVSQELQKVLKNWVFLLQSIHGPAFHDKMHDILNDTDQTAALSTYYVYLLNTIWDHAVGKSSVIPTPVYNTCSEIILKSLELMQSETDSEIVKIDILEKLASYYPDSIISRLSNLAIFFISPTLSRYLTVADGQKKKSKNNAMPEGGDIIVLLPVHLETLMPPNLDPEFKKWIVLRDDLIPYLSEEDARVVDEKDLDLHGDDEEHEEIKFSPEESSFSNASPVKRDGGIFLNPQEMEFAEEATSVLQNLAGVKKKTEKQKTKAGWECPEGCTRLFKTMVTLKEHLKRKHAWSSNECRAMRESMGLATMAVWDDQIPKRKPGRPRKIKPKKDVVVRQNSPIKPLSNEESMEEDPVVEQKSPIKALAVEEEPVVSQMEESAEDVMMSDHLDAMPLQEERFNEKAEETQIKTYTTEPSPLKEVLSSSLSKEKETVAKPAIVDKRKYICPICEREFSHRHTVQAHAEFRHHKRNEEAIEIGKNAKEIIEEDDNGEDEVVNAMVHAKGWYPLVDDFLQELLEEEESTPQALRNNLSEHIFETVTHMYPHTTPTSLDYKAAADYLESSWNLKGSQKPVQDSTNGLNNGQIEGHSSTETSDHNLPQPEATSHLNDFPQDVHFSIDKHDFSDFGTYSSDDKKEPIDNDLKHNNHLPASAASDHKSEEVSRTKSYAVKYSSNNNKGNKSKKPGKATYNKVYVNKKRSEAEASAKTTPKVNKTKSHKGMTFEEALNVPVSTPKAKTKHSKSVEGAKTPITKNQQSKKIRRKSDASKTPPSKIQSASESDSQSSTQIGYSKLIEHAEKNKKDKKSRTSSHKTTNDSATDNSEIPPTKKLKLSESEYDSVSSSNHKKLRKSSFRKYSKAKNPVDDSEERTDILGEMLDQMNNNNKILMPLESDEEKTDSDFICTICNKILTSQFALVCHRRKVHKSKSKVFIPAAMSEKMKIRQLNRTYGCPPSELPKNAKPVPKDSPDNADAVGETCAQARGKNYKRQKISISKSSNRYATKDLREVFTSEGGLGFSCPFETCLNWYENNRSLTRHFINDHCATAGYVMDLIIESDVEYFKYGAKDKSCNQELENDGVSNCNNSSTPGRQLVKRLAATEAAKKISTPEKAKRMWSEYQDLARLYKKSVRKNVARALIPNSDDSDIEMIDRSFDLNSQVDTKALLVEEQISVRSEFFCWICQPCHQESFSDLSNFTLHVLHMLKNIDQYPFRCTKPGCLYGFRVQKNLRKHQRLHKADDGFHYLCQFCPANEISFTSPEGLIKHEKRMHAKVQNRLSKLRRMYCLNDTDLSGNKINEHFLEFGHRTHHDIWKYEAENVLFDVLNAVEEYVDNSTELPTHFDIEPATLPPPANVENDAIPPPPGQEIFSLMKDFQVFKMPTFEGTESNALALENYDDTLAAFEDIGEVSVGESVKLLVMSMIDTVEQSLQIDSLLDDEIDQVGFGELDDEIAAITGTKFYAFWEQKKDQEDIHSPIPEPLPSETEDPQVQSVTITTISVDNGSNALTIPVDGEAVEDQDYEPLAFPESTIDALETVVNDEGEKDDGAVNYCFATPMGASNFSIRTISKADLINYTSAVRMKNMPAEQEETEIRITEIVEEEVEEAKVREEVDEEDEIALSNFVKKPGRRKREVVHKREASSDMEVLVNKRARRSDHSLSPPLNVAEEPINISQMQPVVVCKELDKELLKSPQSVSTNTESTEMNDSFTQHIIEQDDKESQANIPRSFDHVLDEAFDAINRISDFQDLHTMSVQTRELLVALKSKLASMKNNDHDVLLNGSIKCISATKTMSTQTEVKKRESPASDVAVSQPTESEASKSTAVAPYQIMYRNIPTTSKAQLVLNYKPTTPATRPKQVQIVRPLAKQAFSRDKTIVKQPIPSTQTNPVTNPVTTLAIARRPVDNSAFQQPQSSNSDAAAVQRLPNIHSLAYQPRVVQGQQVSQLTPQVSQSTPQVSQSTPQVSQSTPQSQANIQQSYKLPYPYNKVKYSHSYARLEEAARSLRMETVRSNSSNKQSQPSYTVQRPPIKQPQTTKSVVPKYQHYVLQNPPKQAEQDQAPQPSTFRTVSPRSMINTMNHQQYLLQNIMSISEIEDEPPTSQYQDYEHLNQDIYNTETIVTTDVVTSTETGGSKKASPEIILTDPLQNLNMQVSVRNKTSQPQNNFPPPPTVTASPKKLYLSTCSKRLPKMDESTQSVLRHPFRGIAQGFWNGDIHDDKIDFAFTSKDASMNDIEVFSDVCNFLSQVCKRKRQGICKMCKSESENNLEFYLHVLSHTNKQVLKYVRERERAISYKRDKRKSNVVMDKDLKVVIKPLLVHPDEVVLPALENEDDLHAHEISFDKKTCEIFLKAESGKKCGEIICRFTKCKKRIAWISNTRDEAMKHFKQHMFGHHVSAGYYSQQTPLFHSSVQLQPL